MWFGLGLVLIGILLLFNNLGIISGDTWDYIWPSIIVLIGLSILFRKNPCCSPKTKTSKEEDNGKKQ